MKFYCEYCRSQIDADKDKKCPSCNASYKDNKEYKKLLEEREHQKEQIKEQQKYVQKQFKRIGITSGIFALIIPIFVLIIIGTIVYVGIKESKNSNSKFETDFNKKSEVVEDIEVEKDPVMINQEKSSADYKVKFEKYKLIEQRNNQEFDKLEVTLIVEKISDKFSAWGEEIYCLVNNVSQNKDHFNSDNSTYIKDKNVPTSKKITFYIPKDTKSFDIKYGNEISFHIDM